METEQEEGLSAPPVPRVDIDELMLFNDLTYVCDPPLSTCVSRVFEEFHSTKDSYQVGPFQLYDDFSSPSGPPFPIPPIEVVLNTGTRFVSPCSSYVSFDIDIIPMFQLEGKADVTWEQDITQTVTFPNNSNEASFLDRQTALFSKVFKKIEWLHACKRVIDQVDEAGHHSVQEVLTKSADWKRSIGTLMTLDAPFVQPGGTFDPKTFQVLIPMDVLLPSWKYSDNRYGTRLMPNRLVAGSILRFNLAWLTELFTCRIYTNLGMQPVNPTGTVASLDGGFGNMEYTIRNFRVVCDTRQMVSNVDNLLWNQSAAYGCPITFQEKQIILDCVDWSPVNIVPGPPGVPSEGQTSGDVTGISRIEKNISRLDNATVTMLLRPINQQYDFMWDHYMPGAFQYQENGLVWTKNRFNAGFSYWPQNDFTNGDLTKENALLWYFFNPSSSLSLFEFANYLGAACRSFRRQETSETSGKAVTMQRCLQLDHRTAVLTAYQFANIYPTLYERWWMQNQHLLNVYGNILQWRD